MIIFMIFAQDEEFDLRKRPEPVERSWNFAGEKRKNLNIFRPGILLP
jgi:hypothetical protein